jgi:WD40 repeat protein
VAAGRRVLACTLVSLAFADHGLAGPSRLGSDAFTHVGGAYRVAFSPDGRWIATSSEYGIKISDAVTGVPVASHACFAPPGFLVFPSSGRAVICAVAWGGVVRIGLGGRVTKRVLMPPEESIGAITSSRDGQRIAVGGRSGTVTVANARTLRPTWTRKTAGAVSRLAFTPDGQYVVALADQVQVWTVAGGKQRTDRLGFPDARRSGAVAFSRDGSRAAMDVNGDVQVFEVPSGRKLACLGPSGCNSRALWFLDSAHQLVSANARGNVEVWDTRTLQSQNHWQAPLWREATGADLSPDGKRIAFVTGSIRVDLLNLKDGLDAVDGPGHRGGVVAIVWSPDGRNLITAGIDRKLLRWDRRDGHVTAGCTLPMRATALAIDGSDRRLVVGDAAGGVSLYAVGDLALQRRLGSFEGAVRRVAISPAGTVVAAAICGTTLVAWDAVTGVEMFRLSDKQSEELEISGLAFARDGRTLYTAGWDGVVRERDPSTGRTHRALPFLGDREYGKARHANGLALCPDGRWIAVSTEAEDLRVIDAARGTIAWQAKAHTCTPASICITQDGGSLAVPHPDHIELRDAATGAQRHTISIGAENTITVAASPTEAILAVGRADSLVTFHDCGQQRRPTATRRRTPSGDAKPTSGAVSIQPR